MSFVIEVHREMNNFMQPYMIYVIGFVVSLLCVGSRFGAKREMLKRWKSRWSWTVSGFQAEHNAIHYLIVGIAEYDSEGDSQTVSVKGNYKPLKNILVRARGMTGCGREDFWGSEGALCDAKMMNTNPWNVQHRKWTLV